MAKEAKPTFKVGDMVMWISASNGSWKTKIGSVERVVKPGDRPGDYIKGSGWGRDHVSYLIKVTTKKGHRYYWPIASKLELA